MGDRLPGRPWMYLPHAARWYCRRSQLPADETCQAKTALAVAMLRQAEAESAAPILGVFDGAYAVDTVVRPCLEPETGQQRVELVTRLRADARLYHPVGARLRAKGRPPKWGARVAAPQHHVYWPAAWQASRAGAAGPSMGRSSRCTPSWCRWPATRSPGFWSRRPWTCRPCRLSIPQMPHMVRGAPMPG